MLSQYYRKIFNDTLFIFLLYFIEVFAFDVYDNKNLSSIVYYKMTKKMNMCNYCFSCVFCEGEFRETFIISCKVKLLTKK